MTSPTGDRNGRTAADSACPLGFLAAVELSGQGYVGGLLVTNRHGRPLEFQCTTPVKPTRTQEILYGATLVPYLLAEVIGKTLLERCGVKPSLVLVDRPELLELRPHVSCPVAAIVDGERSDGARRAGGTGERHDDSGDLRPSLGRQALRVHEDYPQDREAIRRQADRVPAEADLEEPFERVREALREALRSAA